MNRFMAIVVASLMSVAAIAQGGSDASIERTFDQNKGKLYAEYSRALRVDPTIKGKIVLRIDIGTNGTVTNCRVKYSQLNSPDLDAKLCARIRTFQFEPRHAAIWIEKPIDFFPAS